MTPTSTVNTMSKMASDRRRGNVLENNAAIRCDAHFVNKKKGTAENASMPKLDFLCAVLEIDQHLKKGAINLESIKPMSQAERLPTLVSSDEKPVDNENRSDEQSTARISNSPSSSELRASSSELRMTTFERKLKPSFVRGRPLPLPPVLPKNKRHHAGVSKKRKADRSHGDTRVPCRTKVYLPSGKCYDMSSSSSGASFVMDPLSPPPYLLPKRPVSIPR